MALFVALGSLCLAQDWQASTVVDVVPPERQKRKEPESLHPAVMPRNSPLPTYSALGPNTRWVFVFEANDVTYVATTRALRGDSALRTLKAGDTVEISRIKKREVQVRVRDKKPEKLVLLEASSMPSTDAARDQ